MSWQTPVIVSAAALAFVLVVVCVLLYDRRPRRSLRGRHVLVTGASSGIGRSAARLAAEKGAAAVTLVKIVFFYVKVDATVDAATGVRMEATFKRVLFTLS